MTPPIGILFVCPRLPSPETNGLVLRIMNVAKQLGSRGCRCHLVVDARDREEIESFLPRSVFAGVHTIPAVTPVSRLRHFRLGDQNYRRLANRPAFEEAAASLRGLASFVSTDVMIAASADMAEYVRTIPHVIRIADICDSPTLSLARRRAARAPRTMREAWFGRLERLRSRLLERSICRSFDLIVAITDDDLDSIARSARSRDRKKLVAIANGVGDKYLPRQREDRRAKAAIAFWGNLDFPPNQAAILHFHEKVFVPFLEQDGIRWHIFGPNAGDEVRNLSERHRNIVLEGPTRDLAASLAGIPVMINPMTMGGGLKNKVLESFALGLAVVSTRIGMSGIDAVKDRHYLPAEDPAEFAQAIRMLLRTPEKRNEIARAGRLLVFERYTWQEIGERWYGQIESLVAERRRAPRTT